MKFDLKKLVDQALKEISQARSGQELEEIRIKYLGRRHGILTRITQEIPKLSMRERAGIGTKIKEAKEEVEKALAACPQTTKTTATTIKIDVTAPGKSGEPGSLHPLTKVLEEIKEIFHYLGFTWVEGPEVESDHYNFQTLNMPPDHPARDVQQTYYIDEELLLRTHTSSMQVRYLETHKPPIRVLFPGRCYRRDPIDATHFPTFFQVEGLLVDDKAKMTDLIGSLDFFAKCFFGEKAKIRIYGHHFPYTEPSIEVEVYHPKKGWLEILGAGMVHPQVLKNGHVDPVKFQGWAFGVGADRLTLLKYGIDDIRILYNNDLRFLNQF
jgi:phenylalanyl-tRNA synthetase alpha chain